MVELGESLTSLKDLVDTLYYFRDHFFETHSLDEAASKPTQLKEGMEKVLKEFDSLENSAVEENRAMFLYLKGKLLNISGDFNSQAEALLSRSVKLSPTLVEAWNELGESYMRKNDWTTARTCFEGALQHHKNKVSLRNLSMTLRQVPASSGEEKLSNVEQGLLKGKEAVGMDTTDGQSWSLLGNAYLSHFFQVSQNPKTLKQAMSAYSQAEKDVVAKSTPELHYNKGIALKYEEDFLSALTSFSAASALDPTWPDPATQAKQLMRYLQDIVTLTHQKGKLKAKKLSSLISSLDSVKQLGPYSGGSYKSPSGVTVSLNLIQFSELQAGVNTEKVILGVVICSVHTEDTVPFTFIMVDKGGTPIVVTTYNLSPGKGVIIGDTVAIAEPYFSAIDIQHQDSQFSFSLVRVESPLVLVINGKKAGRELQAGVQMSTFTKTD